MSVFEQLRQRQNEKQEELLGTYYKLLDGINMDSPSAKETEQLEKLMDKLHLSLEKVQQDHDLIRKIRADQLLATQFEESSTDEKKLQTEHLAVCKKRQEMHHKMNQMVTEAYAAFSGARARRQNSQDAQFRLKEYRETHGKIFAALDEQNDR